MLAAATFAAWTALLVPVAVGFPGGGESAAAPTAPQIAASTAPRPPIVHRFIPYGPARRRQMDAYARAHYGKRGIELEPKVIVQHWTASNSTRSALDIFRSNRRDREFGELPGVCAHFLIERNGRILNLVPIRLMCRHVTGLNHRAIGIEHVGVSDRSVMGNRRQVTASIRLTRWLRCRYGIELRDVIGHSENLRSRWYLERVARFRGQTHSDMSAATMRRYREIAGRVRC